MARDIPPGVTICLVLAATLFMVFLATREKRPSMPRDLPVIKRNDSDFETIIVEGREKYPDRPYLAVNKRHSFVVYPPKFFDEIKRLPEHTASAKDFFHAMNAGDWTYVGHETPALLKTIIADLTRTMPARVNKRQEDARMAFESIIGYMPEWKEVGLLMTTFEIVAKLNACAFVGRDLGTNNKWVKAVMQSPLVIHVGNLVMNACPAMLRPLLAPLIFLPTKMNQWDMKKLLTPMLHEDIAAFKDAKDRSEMLRPKEEGKIQLTGMLLNRYKQGEATIRQLIVDYILISFDSTPSTASALYHVICELAAHPEAADVLRKELDEVMVDGKLPQTHLQELQRMDSFLRESFRLHPVSLFSLQRVLTNPVKLSAGPMIPAGAIIAVDAAAINRSPDLWKNPDEFDMNRFYNLRQAPGNENRYHLLTTGSDSPGWGDGIQACPGRFFANSTLKIALAYIVQNYDIKRKENQPPLKMTPLTNGTWAPDEKVVALFKSRK
ncbi:cytochrome P450 [Aspergillus floccosus]